ncbi:nuclear pore complex protein Nup93 [Entomortierella parvispora]|uniref:Nuclear pore protein n=1 Tax=Entomortierella parvispora TaxID=205924 RepID=A0A9P3H4G0_9FUNG|nr:nuclear pore complex protein Nup93 [Entomortierella parvispora]
MSLSTLAQLAESSKQLTSHIGGLQLPHIERGIDQIENQSRKLAAKTTKPIDLADNKAHFFLAKGGVDANAMNSTLNAINLKSTFEPFQPIHDTDTEAFLKYQHEQIIVNTIDESRRETVMDFDSNFETSLNYDWERTKKRIFEELGQHHGQANGAEKDFGASTRSFRGASSSSYVPGIGQNPASLDSLFSTLRPYYKVVYDLCDARLQGSAYPLASSFVEASRLAHKDQANPKIQETWELLVSVLGEQELRNGRFQSQTLKERVYANAYLNSPYKSPSAAALRQHLIRGSRTFLEKQFMNHIEAAVAENPAEANLGGVPSLMNTIRAFVQLKYLRYGSWSQPNLEIANGQAVWAQLYYMLRTGNAHEALKYATEIEQSFAPADRQFVTYLATYLESEDRTLPTPMQERLLSDFNQRIRYSSDTVDPYKLTLYKIIGRCELNKRTTPVIGALEDFMWLQLSMIREPKNDTMPQDKYDLADFQALVLKYGPNYFNPKNNSPLQYFQVLIYSQQFERAIHYLSSSKAYTVETVHMAIALTYYGLLRIPSVHRVSDPNPFTVSSDAQGREISHYNFTQLIHYQARIIAERYPTEALTYLYQICLNTDLSPATNQEQIQLCHSYIQELVLQSSDYPSLLGSTRHGIKTPGVIEKYLRLIKIENSDQFVKDITIKAAASKAKEGRVDDAIQLYSIAEAYNQVIELLNRQLAEVIANPGLQNSGNGPADSGVNIPAIRRWINEYVQDPKINQQIIPRNLETCGILLKLVEFMELYERAKYEAAVSVIEELDLIPLEADMTMIAKKAERFQNLDECVARNFPDVLLKTMESLYKLYQTLKSSPYDEAGRRDHMTMLKRRARTLMMFAGSIKFRMPADTYARLNRLDVMIVA